MRPSSASSAKRSAGGKQSRPATVMPPQGVVTVPAAISFATASPSGPLDATEPPTSLSENSTRPSASRKGSVTCEP